MRIRRTLQDELMRDERVVVWGYSIGATAALEVVRRNALGAHSEHTFMVLVAPLASLMSVPAAVPTWIAHRVLHPLGLDAFQNIVRAQSIARPTFFIHGDSDSTVSLSHTAAIRAAIPSTTPTEVWAVPKGTHSVETSQPEVLAEAARVSIDKMALALAKMASADRRNA